MIINTNTGSSIAARILSENSQLLQKSLKRLSTGSKIASISDDSAGAAVASKFTAQVARLNASKDNVQNMISFAQTQDSYLENISSALDRMSELAMLSTDETKADSDRSLYNKEFVELKEYINTTVLKEFNGVSLFSGTAQTVTVDIGVTVALDAADLNASTITLAGTSTTASAYNVSSSASAATALTQINATINSIVSDRAAIGSNLTRLEKEHTALATLRDNISAARSRIVDVDVAEESANFAKQQILVQSGTAMLAQANILPQSALRLIS
jgi:flagellin